MIRFIFIILFSISFVHAQELTSLDGCLSVKGKVIEHFEKNARDTGLKKRILVFAQIHGDEPQSGELAFGWINRLKGIKGPSNFWRIIPVLNPDGVEAKTRANANGVDLNRNFPTNDWESLGLTHWKTVQKSNPRRFPGPSAGSEPEVKCAIAHIEDFKPDLVISIHTPYGLFDFDGPKEKKIKTTLLPWKGLGTFPGSLGRYLWTERHRPVLTIELKTDSLKKHPKAFIGFQDYLSDLLPH